MTALVFGVIDLPYANAPRPDGSKAKSGTQTTGDVAEWLENEYHIMEVFFHLHEKDIVADLEKSVAGALNSILNGAPASHSVFGSGTDKIKTRFNNFLDTGEIEKMGIPGVPTQAALKGKTLRKKAKKNKGSKPRRSFIDTGAYEGAFKAWVETE